MSILLGVLIAVAVVPPLVASLTICAPKWWREKVVPLLPESDPNLRFVDPRTLPVWKQPVEVILTRDLGWGPRSEVFWGILTAPILVPCSLVFIWICACITLVTRKCPYTAYWERDNEATRVWDDVTGWIRGKLKQEPTP